MLQETSVSLAVGKLDAVVGCKCLVRQSWLFLEGCFVESFLSFSLGCQTAQLAVASVLCAQRPCLVLILCLF